MDMFYVYEQVQLIQSAGFILAMSAIGAGLAMIGAFSPGIGQGMAAASASEAVGRNPEAAGEVRSTMIIGCAIAETSAIYCLLVALILVFVNPLFTMFVSFAG